MLWELIAFQETSINIFTNDFLVHDIDLIILAFWMLSLMDWFS
jgi:hypothetical protein